MSSCGYYTCFKGKPVCNHPTNGEIYTIHGRLNKSCELCKQSCGGIYPSQLPKADQKGWFYDIVDKNGNVISQ